jgi:tetratricopeptide (TPR) repeat protein
VARTIARTDPAQQLADAERAWREARRNASPMTVRDAAVEYVIAARLVGRYKEATLAAREAVEVLAKSAPAAAALVEAHACMSALDAGELDAAERFLGAAKSRTGVDDETASALFRAAGNVHLARRRWKDAAQAFSDGLAHSKDVLERTIALYNIGEASIRLEKFDAAKKLFLEAAPDKERLDDKWGLSYVYWGLAVCDQKLGHLNDAQRYVEKALDSARQIADRKILARIQTTRARVLRDQKMLEAADDAARDAIREATRASLPRERADAHLALAEVLIERGFVRRAASSAEQALDIAQKGGVVEIEEAARSLVESARAIGSTDPSREFSSEEGSGPHRRK